LQIPIAKTSKILVVILIAVALALTTTTLGVLNVSQNVTSSGTITTSPNIGVYSNSNCTTTLTSINWGSIIAGGNATQTFYVKNTGTGIMTLSLSVSNWSPSGASTYLTISWNQQGTQLSAGQSVAATITLAVSSSITGITTFTNTIAITGTG
jgi:hypothetical protein